MFNGLFSSGAVLQLAQTLRPIADVLALSFVFFFVYRFFSGVNSRIFINLVLIIVLMYGAAAVLRLNAVLWVFDGILTWFIIGVLVVFQPELRSLISKTGYSRLFSSGRPGSKKNRRGADLPDFALIRQAVQFLVRVRRGALLVFPRGMPLESIINSSIELDAKLSAELLETIFSHDTPLHDGAVVVAGSRVQSAGCYLPIEGGSDIPPELGSRHRAALSLTRSCDAVVLVVSEERGTVSIACDGEIFYDIGIANACDYAAKLLSNEHIEISWIRDYAVLSAQKKSAEGRPENRPEGRP